MDPQAGHELRGRRPAGGLAGDGAILSDQVKSLDWRARNTALICDLPEAFIQEVLAKLNTLLEP